MICGITQTSLISKGIAASAKLSPYRGRFKRALQPALHRFEAFRGRLIYWYALTLVLGVASLVTLLLLQGHGVRGPAWAVGLLGLLAAAAERRSVRVGSHLQTSVSILPILFAAVIYGPLAAMVVASCALLAEFRRPYVRWVIWTTSRAIPAGAAGLAAAAVLQPWSYSRIFVAVGLAVLVEGVLDLVLVSTTVALRHRGTFLETIRGLARLLLGTFPLFTPLLAVLALAYVALSPWTVLFFLVPAVAAHRLVALYQEERQLSEQLIAANSTLEKVNLSFAGALVAALDARDRYTAGHSAAVAVHAREIAVELGLDQRDQEMAHLAGLLHDVGKVGLPPGILEKEGPLTPVERQQMQEHSVIGERILENVAAYGEIATVVRHHHERFDGRGYPDARVGHDIPHLARVIAVADAFDAMTSGRTYRQAMPLEEALRRLRAEAGRQFDPAVVGACEAIAQRRALVVGGAGEARWVWPQAREPVIGRRLTARLRSATPA